MRRRRLAALSRHRPVGGESGQPGGSLWVPIPTSGLHRLVEQALSANTILRVSAANIARPTQPGDRPRMRACHSQLTPFFGYGQIAGENSAARSPPAGGLYANAATVGFSYRRFSASSSRGIEAAKADPSGQAALDVLPA